MKGLTTDAAAAIRHVEPRRRVARRILAARRLGITDAGILEWLETRTGATAQRYLRDVRAELSTTEEEVT